MKKIKSFLLDSEFWLLDSVFQLLSLEFQVFYG